MKSNSTLDKVGLYAKVGFGLLSVFAMLGNCLGKHQQSLVIFAIIAIVWVNGRVCFEAAEAWVKLREKSKGDKTDPPSPLDPPGPPGPPAAA